MIAGMDRAGADKDAESGNILCCLEFIAKEALDAGLVKIHAILRLAIEEITKTDEACRNGRPPIEFFDIRQAFLFFAKFCLLEDPKAKAEIVKMINNIEKDTWVAYAQNA